ncbi:DUF4278 domain-containing protein [Coleofasciculus sp. FACHB-129]|uniref:DUF4278 domain-containing protein n=1 Tax=Cyanophyceae TaxID=3028117 RepID=UPI001687C05A|nr:DUF4278 domain-containing protein [Coleofasciculus sp. FACHB-129]MBD1895859.1 DUF4278 domain-containing protein [Coleofasciculus sp. FACHB-129]
MKLYYRGLCYEHDPSKVESRKRGQPFKQVRGSGPAYNLIYRRVTYRIHPNAKQSEVPVQPVAYRLMYRGIAYFVNKTAQGEVTVVTQPASTSELIMSEDKYHNASKTRDEFLYDLNLLGLWSECGSNWSSTVKGKIQAATNEPIVQEEPNLTNKIVLFGALTVLALLIAATWMQAPKIHQVMQEAGKTSIEQLILRYY